MGGALDVIADFPYWNLVYIVGPSYDQCRKEFQYLVEALLLLNATSLNLISMPSQGKCSLTTFLGQRIETISSEDGPKAITGKGDSPDIILLVEAGKLTYSIYLTALARVARARGKMILSGTIEESERWYPELVDRWRVKNARDGHSFIVPTWENLVMYPGGQNDPEIVALKKDYTPEAFKERFGAEPSPPASLIYKNFSFEAHVRDEIKFLSKYPVEVWTDPGYSGSFYAVLFVQLIPRAVTRFFLNASGSITKIPDIPVTDVWIIDELYMQHAIHEEVILAAQAKPFWKSVKAGVGDVVMKTHPMAGKAPIDIWMEKTKIYLNGQSIDVKDGIDRHQTFLRDPAHEGAPRLFIHPDCIGLTGEYSRWKRKKIAENLYGEPEKINCDALKAMHYGLIHHFGFVDRAKKPDKPTPPRRVPVKIARQYGVEAPGRNERRPRRP